MGTWPPSLKNTRLILEGEGKNFPQSRLEQAKTQLRQPMQREGDRLRAFESFIDFSSSF
jgi:hypothetical protein